MNRLSACVVAFVMIVVAAIYCAMIVPYITLQTPLFGVPLLTPAFALLGGACFILERLSRHRPKMRPKY